MRFANIIKLTPMPFSTLCTNDRHRQDFHTPLVINDDSSLEQDSGLDSHCQIYAICKIWQI